MNHTRRRLPGYSLLEVLAAAALMALALLPALAIFRDGIAWSRDVDHRQRLLLYGVNKLEEQMALVGATWVTGSTEGDFAADGHADIRYSAQRSDDPSDGGLVNRLMAITITIYHDANNNDSLDVSELRIDFTTKIGRFATYESAAGS